MYDIEQCRRFPKFEAIKLCQNSRIDDLQICLNQDYPGKNKRNYRIKIMVMRTNIFLDQTNINHGTIS